VEPSIARMREHICGALGSLLSTYLSLPPCCMACLMDPAVKDECLPSEAAARGWSALREEVLEADRALRGSNATPSPSTGSSPSSSRDLPPNRVSEGAEAGAGSFPGRSREQEGGSGGLEQLLGYKAMRPLKKGRFDALQWWSRRLRQGSVTPSPTPGSLSAFGAVAAKYCSMDAVHCPAESVFEGVTHRVVELLRLLKQSEVEAMLFLRMNRSLLI